MQFTADQARALQPIVARYLRFLGKLCRRLDALSVDPTDPIYVASHNAFNGVHDLSVRLHYAEFGNGSPKTFVGDFLLAPPVEAENGVTSKPAVECDT